MVDAAYLIPDSGEVYFWAGRQYARIKFTPGSSDEKVLSGPRNTRSMWTTLDKAGFGKVDAVVPVPGVTNQLYVFFGSKYIRIKLENLKDSMVYDAPGTIESQWVSLAKAGFDTVDAAMLVPGKTDQFYFFRGTNYVRVNWNNEIITQPSSILKNWPSFAAAGFEAVDAILPSPTGGDIYYVFRGDQYARIKLDKSLNDTLYDGPKPLSAWKSFEAWV